MTRFVDLRIGACKYGEVMHELAFKAPGEGLQARYAELRRQLGQAFNGGEDLSIYDLIPESRVGPYQKAQIERVDNVIRSKLKIDPSWQDAYNKQIVELMPHAPPEFIYFMARYSRADIIRGFGPDRSANIQAFDANQGYVMRLLPNDREAAPAESEEWCPEYAVDDAHDNMLPSLNGWVDAVSNRTIFCAPLQQISAESATIMLGHGFSEVPHYSILMVRDQKLYNLGFGEGDNKETCLYKVDFLYGKTMAQRCTTSIMGFQPLEQEISNADVILNLERLNIADASPEIQLLSTKDKQHRLAYAAYMLSAAAPSKHAQICAELNQLKQGYFEEGERASPENIYALSLLATQAAFPKFDGLIVNCEMLMERAFRTINSLIDLKESDCPEIGGGFIQGKPQLSLLWRFALFLCRLFLAIHERLSSLCTTQATWMKRIDQAFSPEQLRIIGDFYSLGHGE